MKALSVRDAATRLGVSPQRVRAMIYQGLLAASKVGRSWVLDPDDNSLRQRTSEAGRPLGAATAWAILALLNGDSPDWVHPSVRSKLRRRVRDPSWLRRRLIRSEPRSQIHRWRVHPSDLPKLTLSFRVVPSGLSAQHAGLDVVRGQDHLDVYVDVDVVKVIERRFRPVKHSSRPNLILKVPSHDWVLHFSEAPPPVVAADLLLSDDPRVTRAAHQVLEALVQ
jgi:hypothetical protein